MSKHELYLNLADCGFQQNEVKCLGLIIRTRGIEMDKKKIETITDWPTPEKLHGVRAFLGFANFYRCCHGPWAH